MAGATKIGIPSLIGFIAILVIPTALMGDDALTGTVFWIGLAIVGTHRFSHVVRLAF